MLKFLILLFLSKNAFIYKNKFAFIRCITNKTCTTKLNVMKLSNNTYIDNFRKER